MFKVNNKDTRTTPGVRRLSIVNFEHVNAGWELRVNINAVNSEGDLPDSE